MNATRDTHADAATKLTAREVASWLTLILQRLNDDDAKLASDTANGLPDGPKRTYIRARINGRGHVSALAEALPSEPVGIIMPDGSLNLDEPHLLRDDVPVEPVAVSPAQAVGLPLTDAEMDAFNALSIDVSDEIIRDVMPMTNAQSNHYGRMRIAGQSHRMAAMLATRNFPGIKSDSIFNEGKFSGDAGRIGVEELWLRKQAEAAGVSVNGKWYCKGLADFPGDPTAWVDGASDVKRIAAAKNMKVHGYVEHKGHEVDPGVDVPVAKHIVDREVASRMAATPGGDAEAIRDEVFKVRSGQVDRNPLLVSDAGPDLDDSDF